MTKRSFITVLLFTLLVMGYSEGANAQFWKRKKKHSTHQKRTEKAIDRKAGDDNEEDARTADAGKSEHALTRKEKKELRKKEKQDKKDREKRARKEKKEKEALAKRDKRNKKSKPEPVKQPEMVVRKWSDIEYVPTQKKDHYRIELLAPLFLDELVKNGYPTREIPEKAQAGINFYKGVQIAADSLRKAGFDVDIYVKDVSSIMESCDMLVRRNALDTADLIIGAVQSRDVPVLANYAKAKHINFVSASSADDGSIRDDQYFTMLLPSLKSHYEWIANTLEDRVGRGKSLLFYRTYVQADNNAYRALTDDTTYRKLFMPVLCNSLPKQQELATLIDTNKLNTIVVAVMDNTYADSLLRILKRDFPRTRFDVYGMPSWNNMTTISKQGAYPNLSINVTVPFAYDPGNPTVQYIDRVFRKEYGGKPQEMVYRGYETLFWFANLLQRHGTIFNKHFNEDEVAPMTKFQVRPQWDRTGNVLYMENKRVFVHKYENGSFETLK